VPVPVDPICRESAGYAAAFEGRRTFLLWPDWLSIAKHVAPHDLGARTAPVRPCRRGADRAPWSAWPDETRPGGEPYVRRDGQVNPQRDTNVHALPFATMSIDHCAVFFQGSHAGVPSSHWLSVNCCTCVPS